MANKHNSTTHSREYIINTMFVDFDEKIDDEVIEASLIRLGIISSVAKSWLKEHYIDKQLSAQECAELAGCSLGHIQRKITSYKLNKKKFGITTGNNRAHRNKLWKQKIQDSQPNRKEIAVLRAYDEAFIFFAPSITSAAKKLQISREHIRDCLHPDKKRKTAGGFSFMHKRAWQEHEKFLKIKNKEVITANTSYEDMIAIAKADIANSGDNRGIINDNKH